MRMTNRVLWSLLLASLVLVSPPAFADITSNLLAHWPMDDGSGTAVNDVTATGTDGTRAVTPDGLAGSDYGKRYLTIECVERATALTTGDGKCYIPVDDDWNGWVVVAVRARVCAAVSSSGVVNFDIDICGAVATGVDCSGTNRDLLSTNGTIDANESKTNTAATALVINTANDDLATGEVIRINIDGVGTGTQGLFITVVIQKP